MVTVTAAGATLDPCDIARPLTITHGRSGIDTQPDAPVCEFTWLGPTIPFAVGDSLTVTDAYPSQTWTDAATLWADPGTTWAGWDGTESARFTGRVTAITATAFGASMTGWNIRATGTLAALGTLPVQLARPAETDTERVAAILAATGVPYRITGTPGMTLRADNIERDALSALHEVCASSAGLLWQDRDGTIAYGAADHRTGPPSWRIPCAVILDGQTWTRDLDAIINHVTAIWGPAESPTQETHDDPDSIATWGRRHADITTAATTAADARLVALTVLARRAQPWWRMPAALIDWQLTDPAEQVALLELEVSTGVLLPIAPEPVPGVAQPTAWTVEGWVESWTENGGRITQLAVSDRNRGAGAGTRDWATVRDTGDWAAWTAGSWLDQLVKV